MNHIPWYKNNIKKDSAPYYLVGTTVIKGQDTIFVGISKTIKGQCTIIIGGITINKGQCTIYLIIINDRAKSFFSSK